MEDMIRKEWIIERKYTMDNISFEINAGIALSHIDEENKYVYIVSISFFIKKAFGINCDTLTRLYYDQCINDGPLNLYKSSFIDFMDNIVFTKNGNTISTGYMDIVKLVFPPRKDIKYDKYTMYKFKMTYTDNSIILRMIDTNNEISASKTIIYKDGKLIEKSLNYEDRLFIVDKVDDDTSFYLSLVSDLEEEEE